MSADETVKIMCPNLRCRKILAVPKTARGRTVRCRHCQTFMRVPFAFEDASAVKAAPRPN